MSVVVEMSKVTKTFGEGSSIVRALDGVDLKIKKGEFVAIVGASGSGKSTMMNLIGCLDKPTSGIVKVAGEDLSELNDKKLTSLRNFAIGFVFQSFFLLPKTDALDNVATPLLYRGVPAREARKKAMTMLTKLGMGDRHTHQSTELSGGQQQRVAIARALVTEPSLILADEPTGALDSNTGKQVMDLFETLNKEGKTIVLITHDVDIAKRAKRRITLRDGKIINDESDAA
jgi:putative ABC transport system ATP-binding protein|uniref:Putative ABC transporter ATP-binding protein n=1 Tax=uncultured Actinomycetes bacterium TaxID=152507 RepID=A0A2R4S935_9ACTN|nr:putative ABC transporter ATP-binding protein [uncultured Actinomycetes bacterium]